MDVSMLKQCIVEYLSDRRSVDMDALRNLFGELYRTDHPILQERLEQYPLIPLILNKLSQKRGNQLRRLIVQICDEYRQEAFVDGVRTGLQLILELSMKNLK